MLDAETDALDCPVLQKRRSPPPYTLVSIINSSTGHRALKFEEVKERKAVVVVMVVYDVDAGGKWVKVAGWGWGVGGWGGIEKKERKKPRLPCVPSLHPIFFFLDVYILKNVRVSILVCYVVGLVGWAQNTN